MILDAAIGVTVGELAVDVDLAVDDEVVAIMGPNGAGKTTMLRAVAGLRPLDHGRITIGAAVVDDPATRTFVAPERRAVAMVFQDGLLLPHLDAVANVAFPLRRRGVDRAAARRAASAWLARVGLADRANARIGELSGGEAQRVALARALVAEPAVLLLDEPLAALDPGTRATVRRELHRHLAAFRGARVLVTHDPVDAFALADRLVVLEAGRVAQTGPPAEVVASPRTPFVADVVGTNLWRGRATVGAVDLDGGGALATTAAVTGDVVVIVPPRAVALHRARPDGSPRNVWHATVGYVEPSGTSVRVRLAGPPAVVAEVTPAAASELGLRPGGEVWASVKATEVEVHPA